MTHYDVMTSRFDFTTRFHCIALFLSLLVFSSITSLFLLHYIILGRFGLPHIKIMHLGFDLIIYATGVFWVDLGARGR